MALLSTDQNRDPAERLSMLLENTGYKLTTVGTDADDTLQRDICGRMSPTERDALTVALEHAQYAATAVEDRLRELRRQYPGLQPR